MSTEKTLIIDDDPDIARVFRDALRLNGFKGDVFVDSSEAISAFSSDLDKYKTVICDIRMPAQSGIEVAQAIKKINPSVRMILMSSNAKDYYDSNDSLSKFSKFINKPTDIDQVIKLMSSLLKQ
jgi:DNA-binding NtrC family response regulator